MDAFFASVEQLTRPTLRGSAGAGRRAGRARRGGRRELRIAGVRCAVGHADAPGPPVDRRDGGGAAAARRGLRSRQPPGVRHRARRWCPSSSSSPSTRRSGSRRNWPAHPPTDVEQFCAELRRRVRDETGLVASVGAGSGKQIAKIAFRVGQTRWHPGDPACRREAAARRACGAQAVGDRAGRRGEAASAGHRDDRAAGRAERSRGGQHPGCDDRAGAAPAGPRDRRPPGGRTRRSQADQRRIHLRGRPDHARGVARGDRARSPSTPISGCAATAAAPGPSRSN